MTDFLMKLMLCEVSILLGASQGPPRTGDPWDREGGGGGGVCVCV